jgi:hypothetical protein
MFLTIVAALIAAYVIGSVLVVACSLVGVLVTAWRAFD